MNKIIIAIIILLIAGTTGAAGYYSGKQQVPSSTPTPSPSPESSPDVSESPQPTLSETPQSVSLNTRPPSQWVQGITTTQPTAVPTPQPTPPPTTSSELAIEFINTPSQVHSGDQFSVSWSITGPAGTTGTTSLSTEYNVSSSQGGSSSSVNSSNDQTMGSFTVPRVFSTNLKYGGTPGTIHVTASATAGGQTVSTTRDIQLVD